MKKVFIALMMAVTGNTASFAMTGNESTNAAAKEVAKAVEAAPSGTTYGVEEVTKSHVVVNTPLGRYTIDREEDGSFSFLGVKAKIVSAKNGVYEVKTSLGSFRMDTKKVSIAKL